jgi:hypothetical protein
VTKKDANCGRTENVWSAQEDGTSMKKMYVLKSVTYAEHGLKMENVKVATEDTL